MEPTPPVQRIAVDAMGGDVGPMVVVPGAIAAARAFGVGVLLVGRAADLEAELKRHDPAGVDARILDAPDVIEMDEHPVQAIRRKPRSSITVALEAVKDGRADAMVSAGNSGAVMAAALLVLGRIPGIDRPAIASFLPTARGRTLVLDLGAVTDPKPWHLAQFAQMGRIYAECVIGIERPTIALLSNGEEPTKGNQLVQEAYPLLAAEPGLNFVGNVEGKDLLRGTIDVVVTDGFTGNIALKVAEGTASMLTETLRMEIARTLPRKLAALALRPALRALRDKLDSSEIGGARLLGVNGAVVIAHGRSNTKAIMNAVAVGKRAADQRLAEAIRCEVARLRPRQSAGAQKDGDGTAPPASERAAGG